MPSTSSHANEAGTPQRARTATRETRENGATTITRERRARVARLDRLATTLDTRFRIPGLGIPVGWDSILGLVPGVGDAATALPGAAMIFEARRMGARRRAQARMAGNTGIDLLIGSIPLVGDAFDLAFKSHRRNIAILKSELTRIEAKERIHPS